VQIFFFTSQIPLRDSDQIPSTFEDGEMRLSSSRELPASLIATTTVATVSSAATSSAATTTATTVSPTAAIIAIVVTSASAATSASVSASASSAAESSSSSSAFAPAASAASAAAATASFAVRLGLLGEDRGAVVESVVLFLDDSANRGLVDENDEGEAAGPLGFPIVNDSHGVNLAEMLEITLQHFLVGIFGASDEELAIFLVIHS